MPSVGNVPDWGRKAIRLSICLVLLGVLGHLGLAGDEYGGEIKQACNWAAVTCIVVAAPLIGQVAEVSAFRVLGTIVGGLLGLGVFELGDLLFDAYWASMCVVAVSPLMILSTGYLAAKHSADQLTKFIQLTYVIVGYSVVVAKGNKEPLVIAATRVGGIAAGGLLSLLMAVVVLPRSATVESCRELKKALQACVELNKTVWAAASMRLPALETRKRKHGMLATLNDFLRTVQEAITHTSFTAGGTTNADTPEPSTGRRSQSSRGRRGHVKSSPSLRDLEAAGLTMKLLTEEEEVTKTAEAEKLFTSVLDHLNKVETMLAQCQGEVFLGVPWGRYVFLPNFLPTNLYGCTIPTLGLWRLPKEDMTIVITIVRRVARLQWALLLNFEEGFDTLMQTVLSEQYPQRTLQDLALYTHQTLQDLADAFPNKATLQIDNVLKLSHMVHGLMQTTDSRARNVVQAPHRRQAHRCFSLSHSFARTLSENLYQPPPLHPSRHTTAAGQLSSPAQPAAPGQDNPVSDTSPQGTDLLGAVSGLAGPAMSQQLLSRAHSHPPGAAHPQHVNHTAPNDRVHNRVEDTQAGAGDGDTPGDMFTLDMSPARLGHCLTLPLRAAVLGSAAGAGATGQDPTPSEYATWTPFLRFTEPGVTSHTSHRYAGDAALPSIASEPHAPVTPTPAAGPAPALNDVDSFRPAAPPAVGGTESDSRVAAATNDTAAQSSGAQEPALSGDNASRPPTAPVTEHLVVPVSVLKSQAGQGVPSAPVPQGPAEHVVLLDISGDCVTAGRRQRSGDRRLGGAAGALSVQLRSAPAATTLTSVVTSPPAAGTASSAQAPGCQEAGGESNRDVTSHLRALLTSQPSTPIVFPDTQEGRMAMVRWHSFLWLLDELSEELEEAFLGIAIIMGKLPHPIEN